MKTDLIFSSPAELETACLAVTVLDHGEGDKNLPRLATPDAALNAAVADLFAGGEVTGKIFETVMLHSPRGLRAKRLLLVGGGKAKNYSSYELRKMAGTAARFLKPKNIRSFAFLAPNTWGGKADQQAQSTNVAERGGETEAVKAIVEGAFVGDFDPDFYKSDRKNQSLEQLTVVASGNPDRGKLQRAMDEGRAIGEAQNFT